MSDSKTALELIELIERSNKLFHDISEVNQKLIKALRASTIKELEAAAPEYLEYFTPEA